MRRLVNCAAAALPGLVLVGAPPAAAAAEPPWTNAPVRVERGPNETRERIAVDPGVAVTFARPALLAADGSLAAGDRRVRLDRIRLPPRDQLCGRADGGRWSCGRRAAARLSALVAGRPALCGRADGDTGSGMLAGDCRVGGRSVAETLVEEGWAEAADTGDAVLLRLQARAREARRGLWGDGDR
jgi:endonuclease YncB( thermonuclease family)